MKNYFVHYYRDFGNTYELLYAETPADFAALPLNARRISRKEALKLAREESQRQKFEPSSSGYATSSIYPAGETDCYDFDNSPRYRLIGRIYERV